MLGLSNFKTKIFFLVALENVDQTMCLDWSFVTGRNPSILTKSKAIALRFFPENRQFSR